MDSLKHVRGALINYVLRACEVDPLDDADFDLRPYIRLISPTTQAPELHNILTTLGDSPKGAAQPEIVLDDLAAFIKRDEQQRKTTPRQLLAECRSNNIDPSTRFETWASVIQRATTGIAGQQHEAGVSLYHEFKLLSALVHAAGGSAAPPENLTLISGDFPGIQRFIYTIASDGATKGVRGRSFFLQLLAECVVRRFLSALGDLPMTNALYVAGGNFLLLAPTGASTVIEQVAEEINARMLSVFDVDVSLVVAAVPLPVQAINNSEALSKIYDDLKQAENRSKLQPLRKNAHTEDMFAPYGIGSRYYCAISHREPRDDDELKAARNAEGGWIAPEQKAFEALATDLAKKKSPYLLFQPVTTEGVTYPDLLSQLTGWRCEVIEETQLTAPDYRAAGSVCLSLNQIAFDLHQADGFRLLAAHTPRITEYDLTWWQEVYGTDSQQLPETGDIRDFEMLATRSGRATGFSRLGALRMDVDGLGAIFRERLQPTLLRYMAASDAVSLFFDGYVREICQAVEHSHETMEQPRPNSLYMLYGGGDDLFIVGEWDLLPTLAQQIHDAFRDYTEGTVSISAGIVLVPVKYPFHRTAEMAKEALDDLAKGYDRHPDIQGEQKDPRDVKDAICFLGTVMPWRSGEAWHVVVDQHRRLLDVARVIGGDTVTRNVLNIFTQWRKDATLRGDQYIRFGPYKWRAAYQMSRLSKSYPKVSRDIHAIQAALLTPDTIRLSGPAARWAELERRAQGTYQKEAKEEDRG